MKNTKQLRKKKNLTRKIPRGSKNRIVWLIAKTEFEDFLNFNRLLKIDYKTCFFESATFSDGRAGRGLVVASSPGPLFPSFSCTDLDQGAAGRGRTRITPLQNDPKRES